MTFQNNWSNTVVKRKYIRKSMSVHFGTIKKEYKDPHPQCRQIHKTYL